MASTISNATGVTAADTQTMPGQMPAGLPGLSVPFAGHFTGRPDTVGSLGAMLVPGSAVALVPDQDAGAAPWEWRGSRGKTQAAACMAMSWWRSGAVDVVAWVDASGRASLLDGLACAAAAVGLDARGGAERAAARYVAWLGVTRRRWLVVLDDLRDGADVAGLWPAGPAGITLVTARDPAVVAGVPARLVPVPCYSQREAATALLAWLGADPDQRTGHLDLAMALGCEPAAIAHAGAVISTAELTCRAYRELFLRRRAGVEESVGHEVPATAVTWAMSAEHAEILAPGTGTWPLLVMASLLSPHGIPLALLMSGAARWHVAGDGVDRTVATDRARAAVGALQAAGLLAVDSSGALPVARMSVPLQAAVRAVAHKDLLEQAMAAASDALAQWWPEDDPQSAAAVLLRSCTAALRSAGDDALLADRRHHRALVAAGQSLDAAGLAGPAAVWWQELASDSVRLLGEDQDETLAAACLAASALLAARQPEAALTWAEWVMARRGARLGPSHPGTIKAATVLGRALAAVGRPGDAIAVLQGTATRSARVLGPAHAATVVAWYEYAGACLAAGRASEAIDAYGEVLSCRERVLGADHPGALQARTRLASAHGAAGNMSAALRHYQQAHAGYLRALGAGHQETLACSAGLARAYADTGQMTAATSLLADAISEAERVLPPGDPLTRELQQARADL
jgi:tetratricopeptide (TPR) repeat protein